MMPKKSHSTLVALALICQTVFADPSGVSVLGGTSPSDIQKQAVSAFKAGQFSKAVDLYRDLLRIQPNDLHILKDLMWSYWNAGRPTETIETGKKIHALEPADIETENLMGKAYQLLGDREKAVEAFRRVVSARPGNISARFTLTNACIQAGNLASAESLLLALEKDIPADISFRTKLDDTWKGLGRAYAETGDTTKALSIYQRALGGKSKNPQVRLALARILTDQKNYEEAKKILLLVLADAPEYKSASAKLANVLFLKGEYHASAEYWETAVHLFPEKPEYKFKQAQALYYDGQYDSALKEMDDLIQDERMGRKATDFLFDDAFSRGDYTQAAKIMEESLPSHEYRVDDQRRLMRLATVYEKLGDFSKALEVLERALAHYPQDGEALSSKASVLFEAGKVRQSAQLINKLLSENPGIINLLPVLADCYQAMGDHRRMLETIRLYRKTDPSNPHVLMQEADVLFSMDKRDAAKKLLVDWLKDNGDSPNLPIFLYHGLSPFKRDTMLAYSEHNLTSAFEDHMRSLSEAGFTPLTVPEVDAWYHKGASLPKNPVLITFDDGRLDSFRNADPILKKYHMKATMFVICQNAERDLPNYASWKELKAYKQTGRWDLQAHTDHGHTYIPITKEGYEGLFLVNKKWLDSERRLETRQEWINRIDADHDSGKRKLKKELDVDAVGFAFPQGNFWQANIPNAKDSTDINLTAARNYYDLSFFQDANGFNVHSRDPYLLNRVEPPRNWTGADLIRHISDRNPANRMRGMLLHWAVWQGRTREAYYWLGELKSGGASPYLLASSESSIRASRGNVASAKKFQQQADKDAMVGSNPTLENPIKSENRPSYDAKTIYFDDKDHRRNWTFDHGFTTGRIADMKFQALQRFGKFKEPGVSNVSEHGLGAGISAALGLTQTLNVQGLQHTFDEDVHDQFSARAGLVSYWTDNFRTEFNAAREPLFNALALHEGIHEQIIHGEAIYERGNQWDMALEGSGEGFSDDNRRWLGQFSASRSLSAAATPRVVYRLYGLSNKERSPFYYSPESLIETNLGLTQAFHIRNPYTLTLTYLPGYGKETGHDARFVQNFKTNLACNWNGATFLDLEFSYGQNPSYHSRTASASFGHRFGSIKDSSPKERITFPQSPQPDMGDTGPR